LSAHSVELARKLASGGRVLEEHLAVTEDVVERRAELVPQVREAAWIVSHGDVTNPLPTLIRRAGLDDLDRTGLIGRPSSDGLRPVAACGGLWGRVGRGTAAPRRPTVGRAHRLRSA